MDKTAGEFLAFAETLADAAREILLPAISRDRAISIKADSSYVTETDLAIEARMREMIDDRYPDHGVLGEEHGNRNLDAEYVWVLDPIDGTAPFIAGIPVFGTLIGLARKGRPFLGVIDHPASNDRWIGVAGDHARQNGQLVRTRQCADLGRALMTISNPDFLNAAEYERFVRLKQRVHYTQYGGSCYAYGALASGHTDLAVDSSLDPFDVFACAAVIEGAGGVMTTWSGGPITLDWKGDVIAAGDHGMHQRTLAILTKD